MRVAKVIVWLLLVILVAVPGVLSAADSAPAHEVEPFVAAPDILEPEVPADAQGLPQGVEAPKSPPISAFKVIVLDPGHGGKDSGAIGPGGTLEKDLTLAIALKLAGLLRESTSAEILMTRSTDEYLTLKERTIFANKHRADIFVSVHINAARRRSADGVEVYFLNFEASDADARMAAAFENNVINLDESGGTAPKDDIESILWDLTQSAAHAESSRLAESIYLKLFTAAGGENRGVKQAPFMVLTGATMPAVLVETGFISNPKEEKRLKSDDVQTMLAEAIQAGVIDFAAVMGKGTAEVARSEETGEEGRTIR